MEVLFSGGGTGGHLFPGLAVAEQLRQRVPGLRISFCGSGRAWERDLVTAAGFAYRALPCAPLRTSPAGLGRALYRTGLGWLAARGMLARAGRAVVVGLGGYSSVPLGLAAVGAGLPLVLLEQNAVVGRANRLLAHWAVALCAAVPMKARPRLPNPGVLVTGSPIRRSILEGIGAGRRAALPSADSAAVLLVLGGSQGARGLNRLVLEAFKQAGPLLRGWRVAHQSGPADSHSVAAAYAQMNIDAEVHPFIDELGWHYGRASLVVCRAGGATLSELAVAGVPAIVVPYPHAADNHQLLNAEWYARRGAVRVVVQTDTDAGSVLARHLRELAGSKRLRNDMGRAMSRLARPNATDRVTQVVLDVMSRAGTRARPAKRLGA